jgi:hypothetical protein
MSTPMSLRPVRRVVRLAPCLPRQPSKPPSASLSKPAVRNWVLASFSSLPTVASTKDGSATSRPASATPATQASDASPAVLSYPPRSCSLGPSRSRPATPEHSTRAPGSDALSRGAKPQVARSRASVVASPAPVPCPMAGEPHLCPVDPTTFLKRRQACSASSCDSCLQARASDSGRLR